MKERAKNCVCVAESTLRGMRENDTKTIKLGSLFFGTSGW